MRAMLRGQGAYRCIVCSPKYLGALCEEIEITARMISADLDQFDLFVPRIVQETRFDQLVDALHVGYFSRVAAGEPHLALPILHVEPTPGRGAMPSSSKRPDRKNFFKIM